MLDKRGAVQKWYENFHDSLDAHALRTHFKVLLLWTHTQTQLSQLIAALETAISTNQFSKLDKGIVCTQLKLSPNIAHKTPQEVVTRLTLQLF